jgi:hypothetical protein
VRDEQFGIPIATHVEALRLAIRVDSKASINRVFLAVSIQVSESGRSGSA